MAASHRDTVKCMMRGVFCGFAYFFLFGVCQAQIVEDALSGAIEAVMELTPAMQLKRLRSDLLSHYDTLQRPDQEPATDVLIYFDARHIVALDEKFQTLTVEGILMMKWKDERLKWDPASYNGIRMLRIKIQDIWVPEIYSMYSVKKNDFYKDENALPVQVYSNGTLKWYPPTVFDVPCSAKYKHYPFDSHNCSIAFGGWTHSGREINLKTLDISMSTKGGPIGTEWKLVSMTHEDEKLKNVNIYDVRVVFQLKRTSTIYRYVCVVPTIIVFITSMAGFWLLPSDGSRYLIGCSNVILMSLLLQYLAMTVHAGSEIPLIAQYSATCLCMSGVFLVITVIAEIIRNCSGAPPSYLVRLAHQHMDQYLCLFSFSDSSASRYSALREVSSNAPPQDVFPEEEQQRREWRVVSLVVDRIAFWIFAFLYVVLLGVLASV